MDRITLLSQVGADGVLQVSVPLGMKDANRPVQLTIEPAVETTTTATEYAAWLETLAGKWQGELTRDAEGVAETRESLP